MMVSSGMQPNGSNGGGQPNQPSPSQSSPYSYSRPPPPQQSYSSQGQPLPPVPQHQQSSQQRPLMYPTPYYPGPYGQPGAAEMPRSLSYPSTYPQQGYPGGYMPPMPNHMHSMQAHPSLARHNTTAIGEGMSSMELGRTGPSLGYSFANRLPLVDRPFKCDECVQSFVSLSFCYGHNLMLTMVQNRNHDLKRHKRIHLSVKPFGCDKCGKT